MVISLLTRLVRDTRLFEKVALNISSCDVTSRGELDADELSLLIRCVRGQSGMDRESGILVLLTVLNP